jgi:hypothetical protein
MVLQTDINPENGDNQKCVHNAGMGLETASNDKRDTKL